MGHGALKPWLLDLSASRTFIESPVWNGRSARAAVERAVEGKARINLVWPILNAYVLEQAFKVRARSETLNEIQRTACALGPSRELTVDANGQK